MKPKITKRSVRFDADTRLWEVLQDGKVFAQLEDEPIARELAAVPDLCAALKAIIQPDNGRNIQFDSVREYYIAHIEGGELQRAQAALAKAIGDA